MGDTGRGPAMVTAGQDDRVARAVAARHRAAVGADSAGAPTSDRIGRGAITMRLVASSPATPVGPDHDPIGRDRGRIGTDRGLIGPDRGPIGLDRGPTDPHSPTIGAAALATAVRPNPGSPL